MDSLRLALTHHWDFPYLRHGGPAGILAGGRWQSREFAGLSWELVTGDFLENIGGARGPATAAPEIIFYDPFSGNSDDRLWTFDAFRRLRAACGGRGTELFTFSASTAVRGALLAAGWYVARGRGIGSRPETTVALTPEALGGPDPGRHELLAAGWLEKWRRSGARTPPGVPPHELAVFEAAILQHAQFRNCQTES